MLLQVQSINMCVLGFLSGLEVESMNLCIQVFKHLFLIILDIYLGVELLGHMVTLCLMF